MTCFAYVRLRRLESSLFTAKSNAHQTGLVFGRGNGNGILTILGAQLQVAPCVYCMGVLRPGMLYGECHVAWH